MPHPQRRSGPYALDFSDEVAEELRALQRQAACSQPQPISITRDFSASLQYSLQYLLSSSGGQSHAAWAQVFLVSSAMTKPPLDVIKRDSVVGEMMVSC